MIKDNQTHLNRVHVIADGLLVAGSYMLSYYIKFESFLSDKNAGGHLPMEVYFSALYYLVPSYLFLYYMVNLYTSRRALRLWNEFVDIVQANAIGSVGFMVIQFLFKQKDFSRSIIAIFFFVNVFLTTLAHGLLRRFLRYIRKKGYNIKHILLVGYSRAAEAYISRILENPQWGYDVTGVLDDFVPVNTSYHGVKVIGKIEQLGTFLENGSYDEITITLPLDDYDRLEDLVAQCEKSGVHTKFIPDYSSLFPSNPYTEDVQGIPVINIRYVPLSNSFNRIAKRVVDIVGSLLAIILFSPVMIIAAIAVKSTSKGPLIYKQERIGLNGAPFMMYKFRTMKVQTEAEEKKGWTTKNDPRVTEVGAVLRKLSIMRCLSFSTCLSER